MVEELLPTAVALVAEVNIDERVTFWPDWFFDEFHSGFLGSPTAFFDVAFRAGANNVLPDGLASHAAGDDMIK